MRLGIAIALLGALCMSTRLLAAEKEDAAKEAEPTRVNLAVVDITQATELTERDEDAVGGLVVLRASGNNAPRKKVTIHRTDPEDWDGRLTLASNSGRVRVYTSAEGQTEVTAAREFANAELPLDVFVEGAQASTNMRDVELKLQVKNGNSNDTVRLTVLWVGEATIETSENVTISPLNNGLTWYRDQADPPIRIALGLHKRTNCWAWGFQATGAVQPTDFNPRLFGGGTEFFRLERNLLGATWEKLPGGTDAEFSEPQALNPEAGVEGSDTSYRNWRDDIPAENGGLVWDLDTPGYDLAPTPGQNGTIRRHRSCFKEWASLVWVPEGGGQPPVPEVRVRCGPIPGLWNLIYFSRQWNGAWVPVADVPGDNRAGTSENIVSVAADLQ